MGYSVTLVAGTKSLASANEALGANLDNWPAASDRGEASFGDQAKHSVLLVDDILDTGISLAYARTGC